MKTIRSLLLVHLLAFQSAAVLFAGPQAGRYLKADDYDLAKILPPAPADNSLTTRTDVETVLWVQQHRTPAEIAIAAYFVETSIFQYDAVLGSWFNEHNLPFTAEFFAQVHADRSAISGKGKSLWDRPRPPQMDPRVHACIRIPTNASYPSGHATEAYLWANLLAEAFPGHREALLERARLVAWSRVVGGVHFPTDIVAGQMLGERLARDFLKRADVRAALERVKAEAAPFMKLEPQPVQMDAP